MFGKIQVSWLDDELTDQRASPESFKLRTQMLRKISDHIEDDTL